MDAAVRRVIAGACGRARAARLLLMLGAPVPPSATERYPHDAVSAHEPSFGRVAPVVMAYDVRRPAIGVTASSMSVPMGDWAAGTKTSDSGPSLSALRTMKGPSCALAKAECAARSAAEPIQLRTFR